MDLKTKHPPIPLPRSEIENLSGKDCKTLVSSLRSKIAYLELEMQKCEELIKKVEAIGKESALFEMPSSQPCSEDFK